MNCNHRRFYAEFDGLYRCEDCSALVDPDDIEAAIEEEPKYKVEYTGNIKVMHRRIANGNETKQSPASKSADQTISIADALGHTG